jgi:hypothetical protein
MSFVLAKFEQDWADEFDVYGFGVFDKEKWDMDLAKFKRAKSYGSYGFGSNEWFEAEEVANFKWQVTDISEEDYDFLSNLFDDYAKYNKGERRSFTYARCPYPYELIDEFGDGDEDEE